MKSYLSFKSSWTNPKTKTFEALKCELTPLDATTRAAKGLVWKGEQCGPDGGLSLALSPCISLERQAAVSRALAGFRVR